MLDPYKLIVINLIAFTIFIFIVFILRKIKNSAFLFVLLSSFLPLISLLRRGVHESGDFAINISKSIDLHHSLSFGIFPVHWASLLNATYGYPLFLFTYPLPYYSIVFLKFAGFSFISSEKIVIAASFILSGIGIYLLLKLFLKPLPSVAGAVLYLYAPYHLVDLHYRVALGEIFAYAFLPLTVYAVLRFKSVSSKYNTFLLILFFSLLLLSHQAISLIVTPFILILPLMLNLKKNIILQIFLSFVFSLLLTSFYWLPVIASTQFTHQSTYSKSISFENPMLYLFSPWRMGFLYQGPIGQISFPMGFVQLLLLFVALFYFFKNKTVKKLKKIIKYLFCILAFLLFLLLPISESIWKSLPLITNFQFAYRLMLPISFILAIIGAIACTVFRRDKIIYIVILSAMMFTILNWGTRNVISDIDDANLISRVGSATNEGEGLQPASPIWRDSNQIWAEKLPAAPLEITKGIGKISNIERTPIKHTYIVSLTKDSTLVENTFYFPGWNLYVDDKEYPFSFIDPEKSNLIRFRLPAGIYEISLVFEDTKYILFSKVLSLVAFILILIWIISTFISTNSNRHVKRDPKSF